MTAKIYHCFHSSCIPGPVRCPQVLGWSSNGSILFELTEMGLMLHVCTLYYLPNYDVHAVAIIECSYSSIFYLLHNKQLDILALLSEGNYM